MKKLPCLRVCIVVLSLLFNGIKLVAQSYSGLAPYSDQTKLIMSPPPTASELGKYAEIPVSLYTGIPSISVPLYQINENGYKLDISLSYHASGIKVKQRASNVGLGWSLNAGGVISRVVRDKPDDQDTSYYGCPNTTLCFFRHTGKLRRDCDTSYIECKFYSDALSDEYYFNFNGNTGMFIFDDNNNPILVEGPHNLKIDYEKTFDRYGITQFVITTDEGTKYTFSDRELMCSLPMMNDLCDDIPYCYYWDYDEWIRTSYGIDSKNLTHPTSWYLSKIEFPNSNKKISFRYDTSKFNYLEKGETFSSKGSCYGNQGYRITGVDIGGCALAGIIREPMESYDILKYNWSYSIYDGKVLSEIEWSNGLIKFISSSNRNDILKACLPRPLSNGESSEPWAERYNKMRNYLAGYDFCEKKIDKIEIEQKNGVGEPEPIRNFSFNYSYFFESVFSQPDYIYANLKSSGESFKIQLDPLNKRLKLDSITESNNGNYKPPTKFEYREDIAMPDRFSYQHDFWGYYKSNEIFGFVPITCMYPNLINTPNLIAGTLFQSILSPIKMDPNRLGGKLVYSNSMNDGLFEADTTGDAAQAYILNKVIYPTGGYDKFTYEPHKFRIYNPGFTVANGDGNGYKEMTGGGVRIKRIDTYDLLNKLVRTKLYSYDSVNTNYTSGRIMNFPTFAKQLFPQGYSYGIDIHITSEDFSNENIVQYDCGMSELGTTQGSHVGYFNVTVKETGNGKEVNTFEVPGTFGIITEGDYTRSKIAGRLFSQIVNGSIYKKENFTLYDFSPFPPNPNYDWARGQLIKQEIYNDTGALVKKVTNYYTTVVENTVVSSARAYNTVVFVNDACSGYGSITDIFNYNWACKANYNILIGWKYLYKQEVTTFDPKDVNKYVKETANFEYNNNRLIKSIKEQDSKGNDIIKKTLYPPDYTNTTGFIGEMKAANILNKPVEQQTLVNGFVTSGFINTYKTGNDKGLPDKVYEIETTTPVNSFLPSNNGGAFNINQTYYKPKITYDQYTNGNLLQFHKENDINVSYIWGYNKTYPIAETQNATTSECDYTGFENLEAPGWTTTGCNYTDDPANVNTGNSAITLTSATGPKKTFDVGLFADSHNGYKASVWVKGGIDASLKLSVVGAESTIFKVVNNPNNPSGKWNLIEVELPYSIYKSKVSPTMQIMVSCSGSAGCFFDDLRFYPSDAQMTSYTYDPLIGITSVSDINNKPTIYTYDTFNRLWYIKDYLGNILKKYDYHYKP